MTTPTTQARRSLVLIFGAVLIVAGAGFAAARTTSGPPWAQEPDEELTETERVELRADVEEFFGEFESDCGTELLGDANLGEDATLQAFGGLVTSLESGQTSHMVQGVRSVLENCEDHPNDGLRNALYHHGLNWIRHYEHEQWLRDKFANQWPDGKPGNGGGSHGNPHATTEGDGPGNGHGGGASNGHGNGNAYGQSR